jgi:putative protein-disulfide isomerase
MQPLVIYCYDAYCGWCYGFSPIIKKIAEDYKGKLDFEVLSGGMVMPEEPTPISYTAPYIQKAYKTVESRTGIQFGKDYLWHIFNPDKSDWFPNSEKPAIAMCIFKEYHPASQVFFAADLQYALHFEGRDLTDNESYRHLLEKYQIPEEVFYEKLKDPAYKEKARYEFALVKQLKVSGFPTVFIQSSETKFYLVTRGFTEYDLLKKSIDDVLYSITKESSSF